MPSLRLFADRDRACSLFDRAALLPLGYTVYHGPVEDVDGPETKDLDSTRTSGDPRNWGQSLCSSLLKI